MTAALTLNGCLLGGLGCLLVSLLEFVVVIFWPGSLKRWHWGRSGGGPPVSRIGGASWGIFFGAIGAAIILDGYYMVLPSYGAGIILLAGFIQLIVASVYDTNSHKH